MDDEPADGKYGYLAGTMENSAQKERRDACLI